MKTAIDLYKNKLRAMGMKMEHHQKDADGKVIEHDDEEIKEAAPLAAIPAVLAKGAAVVGKMAAGAAKATGKVAASGVKAAGQGAKAVGKAAGEGIKQGVKAGAQAAGETVATAAGEIAANKLKQKAGMVAASYESEGDELVETPKIDQKLRKDAKPIKPGPLYKTGRTKQQMGDKAVASRRNIRNADDRNAADKSRFGSMSPAKETAERREKHMAARGVKTKGMSEGMATPESGTGKYYNEKKPTEMQLAKRKKMEKVKSLTNQGKHKEASALYKESILSKFNSKVREEYNKDK